MIHDKELVQMTKDIRSLFEADPQNAHDRIEGMLVSRLTDLAPQESRAAIAQLSQRFRSMQLESSGMDSDIMARVFGLLLGRKVQPDDLSSTQLLERLAQSLNTIFDSLNQLISVINTSFSSDTEDQDQTIRQFIGFHLEGEDQSQSLEDYLGQINQAFLITQEAFIKAAHKQVERILVALDTDQVAKERSSKFKIGPLRKAEDYEILKEKILRIQKWFDAGRSTDDFLREFEKNRQAMNQEI